MQTPVKKKGIANLQPNRGMQPLLNHWPDIFEIIEPHLSTVSTPLCGKSFRRLFPYPAALGCTLLREVVLSDVMDGEVLEEDLQGSTEAGSSVKIIGSLKLV